MHGSVHPLMLLHIATGENTDVEHAVTVITAVRDSDVVVVDHTVCVSDQAQSNARYGTPPPKRAWHPLRPTIRRYNAR